MKSILFLFILSITFSTSVGQITKTKVADPKVITEVKPFDSTKNFLGNEVHAYLGQEFYLKGLPEVLRKYGYAGFSIDYRKSTLANKSNVYKCCDSYNSKYSELVEKYFKVIEIIRHPKAENDELLYGDEYYLKLEEKESKDIVYFEYDTKYEHSFPFIVVGYFTKQQQATKGKKIVVRGKNWLDNKIMTDMTTGNPVSEFEPGNVWTAVDLTIEERFYNLALILENSKNEKIPLSIDLVEKSWWVFELSKANDYKKKFGVDNWQRILEGKVKIGMTDEMCLLSWGKPKKINETITSGKVSEQWVYEDNYLYFSNGVLTTIQ